METSNAYETKLSSCKISRYTGTSLHHITFIVIYTVSQKSKPLDV